MIMSQSHDSSVNDTNRAVVSDANLALVSDTATAQIIYYRFSHVFSIKKKHPAIGVAIF